MNRSFYVMIILIFCTPAFSQDRIEADRPSNAVSVNITPKNNFITEIGFEREVQDNSLFYLFPRSFFRYGVGSNVEIRLQTEVTKKKDLVTKEVAWGLQPVHLGAKAGLFEGDGWQPAAAVVFSTDIPFLASRSLANKHWSPDVRLLFNNKISEKLSFDYNIGAEWDGDHTYPAWVYATNLEYEVSDNDEIYAECYGSIKKNNLPNHNLGAGFAHYISSNMKFDVGFSKDLVDKKVWFAAAGFSFLIR